jgi:hypothetical protein
LVKGLTARGLAKKSFANISIFANFEAKRERAAPKKNVFSKCALEFHLRPFPAHFVKKGKIIVP